MRCPNGVLMNLPRGFTHDKPRKMVPIDREDPTNLVEVEVPVGAEVNLLDDDLKEEFTEEKYPDIKFENEDLTKAIAAALPKLQRQALGEEIFCYVYLQLLGAFLKRKTKMDEGIF